MYSTCRSMNMNDAGRSTSKRKKTKTTKMKPYMKHTVSSKNRYSIQNGVEEKKNVSPSPRRTPSTTSFPLTHKHSTFHISNPRTEMKEIGKVEEKMKGLCEETSPRSRYVNPSSEDERSTDSGTFVEEKDESDDSSPSWDFAIAESLPGKTEIDKPYFNTNEIMEALNKKEDEIHKIKEMNKELREQIKDQHESFRQYRLVNDKKKDEEIAHLNNRKETLEQALEKEKREKSELIKGNDLLRRKLQEEKDNVKKYQDRCKEGKDVIDKLLEEKTIHKMIIDDLQDRGPRHSVKDVSRAMPFVPHPPQSNKINSRRPVKLQNDHEMINDIKKEIDVEFSGMKEEMNVVTVEIKRFINERSRSKDIDNMECKHCQQLNMQVGYLQTQLEEKENVIRQREAESRMISYTPNNVNLQMTIRTMKKENEEKDKEIQLLRQGINRLEVKQTEEKNANHTDSTEKLNLLRENKRLKTTSDSNAKRIEELKSKLDSVSKKKNEALTRIKELESEKDKHLKAVQYKFDRENSSLKQENERLKQDIQRIDKQRKKAEASTNQTVSRYEIKSEENKAEVTKFQKENKKLISDKATQLQRIQELECEKECYEKKKGHLIDTLSSTKRELKAKLYEFESLEDEKRRVENENVKLKSEMDAVLLKEDAEILRIHQEKMLLCNNLNNQKAKLERLNVDTKTEIERFKKMISSKENELLLQKEKWEILNKDFLRLKEENEHLKTEARTTQVNGENIEAVLKLQHDNLRLKNEIEDLKTRFSHFYRQQEQEVKDRSKMNSITVKELEKEIENNNTLRKELSSKEEECKNLEIELGNMKLREKSKNLATISKTQQEKQRLETELEELKNSSVTLEKEKYYFIEKCKSYEDLVVEKETLLCQCRDENGEIRKEIQRVKDENMELQKEMEEKISFERNQNSTYMTRLNHEKEQMSTALQRRIVVLTQDKDNISEKHLKLQKELQNQKEENEMLRKEMARLAALTKDKDNITDKYMNLQKELQKQEEGSNALRKEIKRLEAAMQDKDNNADKYVKLQKELQKQEEENNTLRKNIERVKDENMKRIKEMEETISFERKNNNACITRLNDEKKQMTTDIDDLQNRLAALRKDKDHIVDKYMTLQAGLQNLEEENNAHRKEITRLEALVQDKDKIADTYKKLQNELQKEEADNNKLRQDLKRLAALEKDKDHIAEKYMTLEAELQNLKEENNIYRKEITRLEDLMQDKDHITDQYKKLQSELQMKEAENNTLGKEIKRLQQLEMKSKQELGKCKSDIEETHRQMKIEEQERDKEEGRLQQELSRVKDENMKMIKEMEETISVERKNHNTYITRLNDEKKQMTTDLGDLQKRLAALRKDKDHIADKYMTLQAGLQKLEEENNAHRKEITRLEALLQDKDQIADSYKKLQNELQKEEADNNKLRKEMKRMEQVNTHLNEQLNEKISSEKRNEERNAYLVRLEKEKEKLAKDLDIQHNRMVNVMKDRENISQKHARLFEKLQRKEEENDILRKELISCKEKQETYRKDIEIKASKAQETKEMVLNLQFQNNALHKDYEDLKKRLSNEYRKNAQAEGDTNQLKWDLEDQRKEKERLQEELDRLSEEYKNNAEIAGQTKSLQRELAEQKKERESLKRELNRMTDILEKHQITASNGGQQLKDLLQENNLLKSDVQRLQGRLGDLQKQYIDVKREKDHALNRLSSVAGEKLRDNNPAIADLSDENRPINLGEKFTQLYDDQWTDAMENLEESLAKDEKSGIICLIQILKVIFEECVKCAENQFHQLQELTGMLNLPSDQLKKLKDLRKTSALLYLKTTKMQVKQTLSKTFRRELEPCKSYIDRSTELCWLMAVQDPPVVIDFTANYGQDVNDKLFRKFTKTGTKIDYLVWPMIRLHQSGPLLQKGVVQPI